MSEQTGWAADPSQPPHRSLSASLGSLRATSITTATANGREVVVFAGGDEESLPVRFVDLDSGVPLPDRSLLHSAHLVGLGRGADRTLVTTVSARGTVVVREAETGEPVGPAIRGPRSPLAVAIGRAGERELVAVSTPDDTVAWDPSDGSTIAARGFGGHALVAHEGRLLAVSGGTDTWLLRDVLTGEAYGETFPAHGSVVAAVVHRGRVLVASSGVPVRFWDVLAGAETSPGPADELAEVSRFALAEVDGGLAAVVTRSGGRIELLLPGDDGPRRSALPPGEAAAVLAHDGRLLTAVAGRSGALSVTDARSPYYGGPIRSFGGWARRSGRLLAVLSGDPALLYDIETGHPFARVPFPADAPDGPTEVVLDGSGFRLRDTVWNTELLRRDGQHGTAEVAVTAAGYREADDKALLATGGADGSVRLWDVSAREPIGGPWYGHAGPVTAATPARWRGQAVVLSADASGTARMWMVGGPVRHAGHTGRVGALAAGGRAGRPVFASGGDDGAIRFWDPVTDTEAGEPIRSDPVTGLVFAGDILVSAGGETLRRWNPATGEAIGQPLPGAGRPATAELDGRVLVAAIADDHLRVWVAATGEPWATMPLPGPATLEDLTVHDGRLLALTVSDPDKALFPRAGGLDGDVITVWDVGAAAPLFPPMLTSDEGGVGAFGRVAGRAVAVHGVDARKNEPEEIGLWPEETGDLYLRDLATGELGVGYRPEAGFSEHLLITRAGGRDVVLAAAQSAVVTWDAATGHQAAPPVEGLTGAITCVAAIEADGRTYAAAGDWAGTVRIWEVVPRR